MTRAPNDGPDDFDRAMRARHDAGLRHLSPQVHAALSPGRVPHRPAAGPSRWVLPAFGAAMAAAVALVAVWPVRTPVAPAAAPVATAEIAPRAGAPARDAMRDPPALARTPTPATAVPDRAVAVDTPEPGGEPAATLALDAAEPPGSELDEDPDFYLWLAADAAADASQS